MNFIYNDKGTLEVCRGWRRMEEVASRYKVESLFKVKDVDQLVTAFNRKRIESFLAASLHVDYLNLDSDYKKIEIYKIDIYIWLCKSFGHLALIISKALKKEQETNLSSVKKH